MHGEYLLSSFCGRLALTCEGGKQDEIPLFSGDPLVFKLPKNWKGKGRRVTGISKGHFIVIAPRDWTRTGHVPVEADSCTDESFTAHYFFRDSSEESDDSIGGFLESEVTLTKSGFSLDGDRVADDSEEGDLFVGNAPDLKFLRSIAWARIGEEKENGWKGENFQADKRTLTEVLNGRQGRFFVRLYDDKATLLDSGEFRYLRHLKGIHVNGEPYTKYVLLVPSSSGHLPTKIEFLAVDGALVRPILPRAWPYVEAQQDGLLIVKPHPSGDNVACELECDAARVTITLNLPRIWWRLESARSLSPEWRDTPWTLTRREFREHAFAGAAILLRLPQEKMARVGFDSELERAYRRTDADDLRIPMADFVDYSQMDRRQYQEASFNVACGGTVLRLVRILADAVPTIDYFTCTPEATGVRGKGTLQWMTRNTEADGVLIEPEIGTVEPSGNLTVTVRRTTTFMLRLVAPGTADAVASVTLSLDSPRPHGTPVARVRRATGGWRRGSGFSYSELRSAGLKLPDAKRRAIAIDKRRRSTHRANVETVRRHVYGGREQHTSLA